VGQPVVPSTENVGDRDPEAPYYCRLVSSPVAARASPAAATTEAVAKFESRSLRRWPRGRRTDRIRMAEDHRFRSGVDADRPGGEGVGVFADRAATVPLVNPRTIDFGLRVRPQRVKPDRLHRRPSSVDSSSLKTFAIRSSLPVIARPRRIGPIACDRLAARKVHGEPKAAPNKREGEEPCRQSRRDVRPRLVNRDERLEREELRGKPGA
jgi:hypothetical protein